ASASLALSGSGLRDLPNNLSRLDIECPQILLSGFHLRTLLRPLAGRNVNGALLESHEVIKTRRRAERGGIPVRRIFGAAYILLRQKLRTAVGTNSTGPGYFNEVLRQQELAVGAVENIEEPIPIRMQHEFSIAAPVRRVHQDGRRCRVPDMHIMRRESIMPLQLSAIRIQSQDKFREKVGARPVAAVRIH